MQTLQMQAILQLRNSIESDHPCNYHKPLLTLLLQSTNVEQLHAPHIPIHFPDTTTPAYCSCTAALGTITQKQQPTEKP